MWCMDAESFDLRVQESTVITDVAGRDGFNAVDRDERAAPEQG